eukprot:12347799-Prorocentrum_lima.AAC.1
MTSSLVGSEMCIRDSVSSGSDKHFLAVPAGSDKHSLVVSAGPDKHFLVCLLYTSDAADDM